MSHTTFQALKKKIVGKSALVGVIGIGYVGLPLAVTFAEAGFKVLGFDIRQSNVDAVNQGRSYIGDVSDDRLSAVVTKGVLSATLDQSRLKEVDAVCICVPTPLTRTKEPDISFITQEVEEVALGLHSGELVILESTTYPGTTREVVLPILEKSGLKGGRDFFLAYSPERVDPGSSKYNTRNTPKLVGGIDAPSTELAELLYRQTVETIIPVSSAEVAEMTKIFENVFRNVNIALVNELAQLCERMGMSVWEVIAAAATKPFGFMSFYPGPGVGGHCIPKDPYYLAYKAREYDFHTRFIELAAEINEQMPYHVVHRVMEALSARGKSLCGAQVLVLGVAYKPDVSDIRESPSLKIIQLLQDRGAQVSYNDPFVPKLVPPRGNLTSVELTEDNLSSADCVVLATVHSSYNPGTIAASAKLVLDTRGITRKLNRDNVIRLGE